MIKRFGDLAINPSLVVAVSKRLVNVATSTGGSVENDESCMIVTNEKRTATNVIPVSVSGAESLLKFIEEKTTPQGDLAYQVANLSLIVPVVLNAFPMAMVSFFFGELPAESREAQEDQLNPVSGFILRVQPHPDVENVVTEVWQQKDSGYAYQHTNDRGGDAGTKLDCTDVLEIANDIVRYHNEIGRAHV
jgi:hypothetical protein